MLWCLFEQLVPRCMFKRLMEFVAMTLPNCRGTKNPALRRGLKVRGQTHRRELDSRAALVGDDGIDLDVLHLRIRRERLQQSARFIAIEWTFHCSKKQPQPKLGLLGVT